MRALVLLLLGTVAMSSTASAQSAAFKCPASRIVVEHSDGASVTWTGKMSHNACETITKRAGGSDVTGWFYAPAASIPANHNQNWATQVKAADIWPLVVGKKVKARFDGATPDGYDGTWYYTFEIERAERLTTQAGIFNTVVVRRQAEGTIGSFAYKGTLRQWYAAEPGVTVKTEYDDNQSRKIRTEATKITQ